MIEPTIRQATIKRLTGINARLVHNTIGNGCFGRLCVCVLCMFQTFDQLSECRLG